MECVMSSAEMPKAYESAAVEEKWYSNWESNGLFKGRPNPKKKPYSIVIPPPNSIRQRRCLKKKSNSPQSRIACGRTAARRQ